ncbi:hypothetical protein [Phytohabitans rumicis]|uniref:Uncharacterized protein n=1 Tax=Phytohabitans rumicis TaxID=1076125 RepID=A0A6V8KS35_9ACTN|nr:hypothetical protein [Phytohabitans rumicis]GFJ86664.1 hypothetical protein Prum_003060 [Phytohabitans rumicis]
MSRRYLPWWRQGAAALVTVADAPGLPSRAELAVTATVNAGPAATVTARLYGPGEVGGIDARQVIRTEPPPGTPDFEPNYFPAVELDAPDLPWAFTPATANAAGQLRPWLVLVAVRRAAARLDLGRQPLPVLGIDDAGAELPDLAQSWAWTHVQVTGTGTPAAILTGDEPARTLARLLCPRKLDGDTAYVAALVPAFAQGVQAGLGQPVDPGPVLPAWDAGTTAVELPVYFSWEFATGPVGDFEELVARLRFQGLDADALAGLRVEVTGQPAGMPDAGTIRVPGALGNGGDTPPPVDPAVPARLRDLLEIPGTAPVHPDLPVALPAYARWHAGVRAASALGGTGWFAQLNLHPAARAVAALGTRIVQDRQEQLMAAAWAQAGEIERANRLLRQGQFAREASAGLHRRHLAPLPDATVLALAGPAHTRLLAGGGFTVAAWVAARRVPAGLFTVAARRIARPRGPFARRWPTGIAALIARANARDGGPGGPLVGRAPDRPPGMVSTDQIGERFDLPRVCTTGPEWWPKQPGPRREPHRGLAAVTRKVLAEHAKGFGPCSAPPPPDPLPVADLAKAVRTGLDPERAVTARIRARLTLPAGWSPPDALEPVLAAPEFPTPMYRAVAELAPDLLLPDANAVPGNSVCLVGTNPWFVQAVMAGLNHEIGRELLWRGFPTDQRGTCFRRFWDRAGAVPRLAGDRLDDIRPIPDWPLTQPLGAAGLPDGNGPAASQLVLLVRGELLRRYPRTTIYAAKAAWRSGAGGDPTLPDGAQEEHPLFGGSLPPDVTFFGFGISPADARGSDIDPGWYIVFQQQPTEARFGLDVGAPSAPTGTWGDLSWADVTLSGSGHALLGATDPITVDPAADARGLHFTTAATSAQIAAIVEQRPYRVAVHAAALLPEPPP